MTKTTVKAELPILLSAKDIQSIGLSRSMAYQLLNRSDVPVVAIGGRKFINRDKFFEWIDNQTQAGGAEYAEA